jgi:hypothetical protein
MKTLMKFLIVFLPLTALGSSYKYQLSVKDASQLKEASNKNPWMQKFYDDVLYQGLVFRLAPMVFSMGEENEGAWKGRFIDYIFESILKGRPISATYYTQNRNQNPIGMTVHDLSETEITILKGIIKVFGVENKNADAVSKISYRNNTFGLVIHENCVSLSRNENIVSALAKEKCNIDLNSDASLTLDLSSLMTGIYPLLENFVGLNERVKLGFAWNSKRHAYEAQVSSAEMNNDHIFRIGQPHKELLDALPAHTGIWGLATIADFGVLNKKNLEKYFLTKGKLQTKAVVPMVYGFLGMDSKQKSKAFLLLPLNPKTTDDELAELFNETGIYDVKFKKVCQNLVVFSPSQAALDDVEESCLKKVPSFAQISKNYTNALKQKTSAAFFLNLGALTSTALDKGAEESILETDEYKSSYQLLKDLPHFLWSGVKDNHSLVLKGIKP